MAVLEFRVRLEIEDMMVEIPAEDPLCHLTRPEIAWVEALLYHQTMA